MKALLLADVVGPVLAAESLKALSALCEVTPDIDVLVVGSADAARDAATLCGVQRVLHAETIAGGRPGSETIADTLKALSGTYDVIAGASTAQGVAVLPRLAGSLGVAQVTGVRAVAGTGLFQRAIFDGAALETVEAMDSTLILTIDSACFAPAQRGGSAPIVPISLARDAGLSRLVSVQAPGRPQLETARIVVAGGRALGSRHGFDVMVTALADRLGAAIGATRPAIDAGFVASECLIGQTGKIIAPELYIATGISGDVQHMIGVRGAGTIIAINSDARAPIMAEADYALVGDLFVLVPALLAALDG